MLGGLQRILRANQENHERDCGHGKKGGGSWRNSKANRHHNREINKRQHDGGECSEPLPDKEEEDVEEAVPGNKLTLDNLAEGF